MNHLNILKRYQIKILKNIIKQNLDKLSILFNINDVNYDVYLNEFNQKNILKFQLKTFNYHNYIYVLNTSLFWGIDYFGEVKFNEYINFCLLYI